MKLLANSIPWSQPLAPRSHVEGNSKWMVNSLPPHPHPWGDPHHLSRVFTGPDTGATPISGLLRPRECGMPSFGIKFLAPQFFSTVCSPFGFCQVRGLDLG